MATNPSPWVDGNFQRVRFYEEAGHLVKEWDQPDRKLILSNNVEKAKYEQTNRFLGGWHVGSIPEYDYYRFVLPKYPELESPVKEDRDRAIVKFSQDSAMQAYVIKPA